MLPLQLIQVSKRGSCKLIVDHEEWRSYMVEAHVEKSYKIKYHTGPFPNIIRTMVDNVVSPAVHKTSHILLNGLHLRNNQLQKNDLPCYVAADTEGYLIIKLPFRTIVWLMLFAQNN